MFHQTGPPAFVPVDSGAVKGVAAASLLRLLRRSAGVCAGIDVIGFDIVVLFPSTTTNP